MEKTVLPLGFIATMSAIFLLGTPGGLGDISNGITPEFLWFFIPAIIPQFISYSLRIIQMAVGPDTWKKVLEEYAKKAMVVCVCFELLALYKTIDLVFSDDPFGVRSMVKWLTIGTIAFLSALVFIDHLFCAKQEQVKESQVGPVINLQ